MKELSITEITQKLIGPTQASGCHEGDQARLENVETLGNLIYDLTYQLIDASTDAHRQEDSMQRIGKAAQDHLGEILDLIKEKA